ncbi:MAG: Bax inhibitor-1 family protein [Deltaproteobacteria bacterium]
MAYLRKVYALLAGSALVAIVAGMLCITVGPTETFNTNDGIPVQVPIVVAMLLGNRIMWLAAFGLLMGATFVASWVSKVKGLNVIALFAVAAIMGLELAPMVFVANVFAGLGRTVTADPVRDAFIMVGAVFAGITTYIFITKKDFSYLRASLSMGFFVIFAASILAMFMGSEPFSLAVAAGGSVLSAGFLLYVTSYIFRNSSMDDPVGDALALLVQLRNLFMFILRMFMSSRD